MVEYKLTYFPVRGSAEVIRQIFAVAGVKYEDHRIPMEEFPKHKHEQPFGQLPVLEVDGKQLAQSFAIARYLANQYGLAGKTDFESAVVDSLADQFKDAQNEIRPFLMAKAGFGPGDVDKLKAQLCLPTCKKLFEFFTKFLLANKSNSGFLVGSSLTWVDLLFAEHIADLAKTVPEILDGFSEIVGLLDTVHSIPAVKKWRETCPLSPF